MKVNYCLILAAGHGTRMGELGKTLPKPLWPIFDKVLLGLQIEYALTLKPEKIYINAHHQAGRIKNFIEENYSFVEVLHEENLLGSGGGIHNLAQRSEVNYNGNLLLINSDQFYLYNESFNKQFFSEADYDVRLVGLNVNKGEKYNGLVIQNDHLKDVKPPTFFESDYQTYSGVALINLSKLQRIPGNSSFFDTVANYRELNVEVLTPDNSEYWDFGTKDLYKENIIKLKTFHSRGNKSSFLEFCKSHQIFNGKNELMEIGEHNQIFLKLNDISIEV